MSDRQAIQRAMSERHWRLWAGAIAICAWGGLVLQAVLIVARGYTIPLALWRMAIFFTILSNLVNAVVFTGIAAGSRRLRHPLLLAGMAMTMALVGSVFELMLRHILHLSGWRLVTNALLHDAVPLLTVGAWLVLAEKGRLRARDPWLIAIFPLAYLAYALARGAEGGFYPYPFIDPGRIGWGGVTLYVLGISGVFLIVGHLLVVVDRWLARRRDQ